MSRKQTDPDTIRIQFTVKKGDFHFDNIKTILERYPSSIKGTSIKMAIQDLLHIFNTTETENSSDLFKKLLTISKEN